MTDLMEAVTALAKRRGIAFQSSEIYGGLRSVVGLRSARRRAPPEHPQRLVAFDGPAARRDRGPGGGDHHVAPGVGGVRPRRGLLTIRSSSARAAIGGSARTTCDRRRRSCPNCGGTVFSEPKQFNLMFKTHMGPVEDDSGVDLPASRDRAGDVRRLPARADRRAQEAAVRDRADRQVVPQRDHAGELHLPHARVRADGDGVLRRARHGRRVVRLLGRTSGSSGTWTSASRRTSSACGRTIRRSWRTTRSPRPTSSTSSRSAGRSSRASRTGPTST